jgi:hypothetical protein
MNIGTPSHFHNFIYSKVWIDEITSFQNDDQLRSLIEAGKAVLRPSPAIRLPERAAMAKA